MKKIFAYVLALCMVLGMLPATALAESSDAVELPEVVIADIKDSLTENDPDLTFALNFAIKNLENLSAEYLEALFEAYGSWYTDYVLTISDLTDESVTFNSNGNADGYLAGQYDAWSENWVSVPFSDVTVKNNESLYIMEYAARLMNKQGLRFTLAEVASIVQNFDCGVYFTPEFLDANHNMKVTLELKVFTEAEGEITDSISVATNEFVVSDAEEDAVAKVGEEYYFTLAGAIAAAETGDTVTLLKDVELTTSESISVSNKTVTIDLNGKDVIAQGDAFVVTGTGNLTLKDNVGGSEVKGGQSGTVTACAVWAYQGGKVTIQGGSYCVGGDTTSAEEFPTHQNDCIYAGSSSSMTSGTIVIEGGTFTDSDTVWLLNMKDGTDSSITVTGGTFNGWNPAEAYTEPAPNSPCSFVPAGYYVEEIDGTYTVHNSNTIVGKTVTLDGNITVPTSGIHVNADTTVNLNGKTISAPADTDGRGVFYVTSGATLTINGEGTINGVGNNDYSMAIWADGGNVVINGGTYTNVGAGEEDHYDLIYVKNGGSVEINSGTFTCQTPNWTLNKHDSTNGTITVKGGTFTGYNPAVSNTENPTANFVATGYKSVQDGQNYVVSPEVYTVIWMNGETTLETDENVAYGTTPEYNGGTPTKDADVQYTYTFNTWTPAVSGVTGNVTYTATFNQTVRQYTATFNANGGNAVDAQTVDYNTVITLPTPTHSDPYYAFNGWSDGSTTYNAGASYTVTGNVTFTAQWTDTYVPPVYVDPTPVTPPTTTEKTENEDGSTTTTVTDNKTGTTTSTTENVDGSTTTVETKKDGTVTETVENTDGSSQVTETKSETTTNKDGSTTTTTATKTESTDASGSTVTEVTETKADTVVKADGTTETKTESTTTATDAAGNVTTSTTTATETTTVTDEGATVTEKVEETKSESAEATVETKTTATTTATEEKTETVAVTEQTVTKADGTTETTKTTTTETALADGSTGTAVTDETGKTEAAATVSEQAAAAAAETGAAVALPIPAVTAATDSETASTVTVTTNSDEATKVEIPVAEVTTSTVAVIVNEDGTETVITETRMSENGLVIDVPDGATVKIVDNSTDFGDVKDNDWEKDAVNYASARGLVNGVGNNSYDLDGTTTRAQIVTLLARLAGVDTTPDEGETWYDKAHDWAVDNGITYAGNMNGAITRHEMMTLLWRYVGAPESDQDLSHFTDTDKLTAVTAPAARWAVETGLVGGHGDGTMDPEGTVTRGQLAQFMMNFLQMT